MRVEVSVQVLVKWKGRHTKLLAMYTLMSIFSTTFNHASLENTASQSASRCSGVGAKRLAAGCQWPGLTPLAYHCSGAETSQSSRRVNPVASKFDESELPAFRPPQSSSPNLANPGDCPLAKTFPVMSSARLVESL